MELIGYVDYGAGMILCRPCGSAEGGVEGGLFTLYDVELSWGNAGDDTPDNRCDACRAELDSASGYGVRSCRYYGCDAILSYPDEGAECGEHAATVLRG
jgi:hypothetical protein